MRRLLPAAALSAAVVVQSAAAAGAVTPPVLKGAVAVYATEVAGTPYTQAGIAANSPVAFTKPVLNAGNFRSSATAENGGSQ